VEAIKQKTNDMTEKQIEEWYESLSPEEQDHVFIHLSFTKPRLAKECGWHGEE